MRILIGIALAAGLAGCAKPPAAIAPAYVSDIVYRPLSCGDLAVEAARTIRLLQALQRSKKMPEPTILWG